MNYGSKIHVGSNNGFEVFIPTSGGKAGKGQAKTGTVQVRRDSCIVKQYRFMVGDSDSLRKATAKARRFTEA